jgi:hypothetical protein
MSPGIKQVAAIAAGVAIMSSAEAGNEWRFAVSLDGKPIGYHNFFLRDHGKQRTLQSHARFSVKFWFIDAYRYAHEAKEVWQGDCLQQLDAHTDDNGQVTVVRGERDADRFTLADSQSTRSLRACVQTFAYWNPSILDASALLNPQTGEYVPVTIERLGNETLRSATYHEQAIRYRITGMSKQTPLRIDLWYSQNGEWLALESTTDGDRHLKYTRQ